MLSGSNPVERAINAVIERLDTVETDVSEIETRLADLENAENN